MISKAQHFQIETRLKWIIWVRAFFLGALLFGAAGFNFYFEGVISRVEIWLLLSGIAFSFGSRVLLAFSVLNFQKRALAWSQIVFDMSLVTALVAFTGGIFSGFISVYGMSILASALLLFTRGALVASLLATAGYLSVGLWTLMGEGIWTQPQSLVRLLFVASTLLLVGGLTAILFRNREDLVRKLQQTHSSLEDSHQLNSAIVQNIPEGIMLLSEDRVIFSNPAADSIFERSLRNESLQALGISSVGRRETLTDFKWTASEGIKSLQLRWMDLGEQGQLLLVHDRSEIQKLEEEVRLKDRLASVGQLAAGLAHEIKNPLASLSGSIQLMKRETTSDSGDDRLMEIVLRETDRLDELLVNFLNYAKPSQIRLLDVNFGQLADEVVQLFRTKLDQAMKNIRVRVLSQGSVVGKADPNVVKQVLWNLLRNAEAAIVSKGDITVTLDQLDGDFILMSVKDEGKGMSPETQKRIFEPFYTERSQGIGLGLALVYQMLQFHEAKIEVRSELDKGSEFRVVFKRKGPERISVSDVSTAA